MFGHQDDLAYGVGWWDEPGQSDVKRVTGTYSAVVGWDVGVIDAERNIDSVAFTSIISGVKYAYKMGAINTISWHMNSPLTGQSSWDQSPTVAAILPGGYAHEAYLDRLDKFAQLIRQCSVFPFQKIPIIFRPFHEHNGDWFWWGRGNCSEAEYIQLWRFTVDYLREEKRLHHLIYAFSPDKSRMSQDSTKASYLYGYPGDDYVDVIGLDNYWDVGHHHNRTSDSLQKVQLRESISVISDIAREKHKVAALTETGSDGLRIDNWYTQSLLEPVKTACQGDEQSKLAWMLVWRNAGDSHFYVPPRNHTAESDFQRFAADPYTLFLKDIANPYK